MTHYKFALLGIIETRWTQTGQRRIPTGELYYSSPDMIGRCHHTEGVECMLSRVAQMALIGREAPRAAAPF